MAKQSKGSKKRANPWRILVAVLAAIFSALAFIGLLAFIWHDMFIVMFSYFPRDIQQVLVQDIYLSGGIGVFVLTGVAAVLWFIRTKIEA
jgi:hypothetical protein